jgi:hypothetical protein
MTVLPKPIPLHDHRASLQQYLRGIAFPSGSVAGRIIEERLAAQYLRDPVRPCLVLWSCAAAGGNLADALPVAAAFDLFDRFLLLHDELIGDADAPVAQWGLGQSLNAGDALYALAFRTLASDIVNPVRRLGAAKLVAAAVLQAIEHQNDDSARSAVLTGAALESGAVMASAPDRASRGFARAGRLLGMARLAANAELAGRFAMQAVAALRDCTSSDHLTRFEEVARYVAQRAA